VKEEVQSTTEVPTLRDREKEGSIERLGERREEKEEENERSSELAWQGSHSAHHLMVTSSCAILSMSPSKSVPTYSK